MNFSNGHPVDHKGDGLGATATAEPPADNNQAAENAARKDKDRPPRAYPNKPLPPERMAVSKQLEVLRAFVIASNDGAKVVQNGEVAKIVNMHVNNACVGNTFMVSAGLLMKQDGGHFPAQDAINFNRAFQFGLSRTLGDGFPRSRLRFR